MIEKREYEEIFVYHEFHRSDGKGWLASGEKLVSGDVTITEVVTGDDMTSSMISNIDINADTRVKYMLKGGTAGKEYYLKIRAVSDWGQKFEDSAPSNNKLIVGVVD